ncbi:hypothetical protein BJ875DRAFT_455059 [Amylocarpus encephaloides]|uniref:Uncharacterized protein n=1 Tax=Amylocarpus encephaloides TaxID=45428 RepID=A0A9P7YNT2_9HELO|nr:hypothetical protein BJ875DRAFT_455059 [Amylocarpus encephaloides]
MGLPWVSHQPLTFHLLYLMRLIQPSVDSSLIFFNVSAILSRVVCFIRKLSLVFGGTFAWSIITVASGGFRVDRVFDNV